MSIIAKIIRKQEHAGTEDRTLQILNDGAILVVDDSQMNLETDCVKSGKEAIQSVQNWDDHLVFQQKTVEVHLHFNRSVIPVNVDRVSSTSGQSRHKPVFWESSVRR